MKYLITVVSIFAIVATVFAQDSTGTKISKAVRKTEQKVGTYAKKTSKGFNHAVQRTDKRYATAEKRKQDKNRQITTHTRVTTHTVVHTKVRHRARRHRHVMHRMHRTTRHTMHRHTTHVMHHTMMKKTMDKHMDKKPNP
ncbi:MAG TPA: hypothetical protein VGL56_10345 [Fimbriimonadaceae bacterium]|jgi:hypothetical protein